MDNEDKQEIETILDEMERSRQGKKSFHEQYLPSKKEYNENDEDLSDCYEECNMVCNIYGSKLLANKKDLYGNKIITKNK